MSPPRLQAQTSGVSPNSFFSWLGSSGGVPASSRRRTTAADPDLTAVSRRVVLGGGRGGRAEWGLAID